MKLIGISSLNKNKAKPKPKLPDLLITAFLLLFYVYSISVLRHDLLLYIGTLPAIQKYCPSLFIESSSSESEYTCLLEVKVWLPRSFGFFVYA